MWDMGLGTSHWTCDVKGFAHEHRISSKYEAKLLHYYFLASMMSDSESNSSQSLSDTEDESSYIEKEDVGIVNSIIQPYQDEPLAVSRDSSGEDVDDGEDDEDGIPFATLEARYEKRQPVNVW